jgi:FAD/FMN-containing dehydrogenase
LDALENGKSAAYINEANWMEKKVFYGQDYARLQSIKRSYDPTGMFYSLGAVDSDLWVQQSDGRLCRK